MRIREPYIGKPQARIRPTFDLVPADEVREHMQLLRSIGMSHNMIARAAGVSAEFVKDVARQPDRRVNRNYAAAVLAVDGRPVKHQALVLGVGTNRRLQGLAVCGWSLPYLAGEMGFAFQEVYRLRHARQVSWANYARVRGLFDRLGIDGGNEQTKRNARRHAFVHPLLWDDIDDPFEVPQVVAESGLPDPVAVERLVAGSPVHASSADKREAFGILLGRGWTVSGAAARVGINYQTAVRYSGEVAA